MKKLGIVMLIVLVMLVFSSCAPSSVEYEELTEEWGEEEIVHEYALASGLYEADLKTRHSGVIGKLKIWNDADYLYVEFSAIAPWKLTETYFDWASSLAGIPRNSYRRIDASLFDYKWTGNEESMLFTISRAGMPSTIRFAEASTFVKRQETPFSWIRWYLRDRQGVCIGTYSF